MGEGELLEEVAGAGAGLAPGEPAELADHHEVLQPGEALVDARVLAGEPDVPAYLGRVGDDVEPRDPCPAGVRTGERAQHPHRGGLARPVRAEDTEDGAGVDPEIEPVERARLAVELDEALRLDRRRHAETLLAPTCPTPCVQGRVTATGPPTGG